VKQVNDNPTGAGFRVRMKLEKEGRAIKWVVFEVLKTKECVFHAKTATDSRRILPPIPRQSCHLFHTKAATDSIASLPLIPRESCH